MLDDGCQGGIAEDHAAPLRRDCSWALFRRVEIDKNDGKGPFPVTLCYDPVTGTRIKASELPVGWQCSYEDAVKALETSGGYYDGIAFLLTEEDPYHVTIVKGGGWAMRFMYCNNPWDAMVYTQLRDEATEILQEQNTYAFDAPFGSDIYVIGKANRPEGLPKKCGYGYVTKLESYDGGWDKSQKKHIPRFIPFSEATVEGYDIPINDVQDWLNSGVPDSVARKKKDDEWEEVCAILRDRVPTPPEKIANIKPVSVPPENTLPIVSNMRCAKWAYENPRQLEVEDQQGEHQGWKWDRFARSPKTGEVIRWGEGTFEETKHLWGSYDDAHRAYNDDEESQGVLFLVEPYQTFKINEENHFVVFFDFDDCRDPETGEVSPQVKAWMEELDTYFEISPSGKGVRGIGLAEKHPGSRTNFKIDDQRVEVYGGNQGGRHLITFTGTPIEGFDKPIKDVQEWVEENIPVNEANLDSETVKPALLDVSDEEIIQTMLRSKDGHLIKRFMAGDETLWEGKNSLYNSRSQADLGFFRLLAFYTRGDEETMERIALSSRMRRIKWDDGTYLINTIDKAISYCKDFYDPYISSSIDDRQEKREELIGVCGGVCMSLKNHRVRKNFEAFVATARSHGWYSEEGYPWKTEGKEHYIPDEGILFYHSIRNHGLYTGENDASNISRQMKEVLDAGLVKRIYKGTGSKNSLYLIPNTVLESMEHEGEDIQEINTIPTNPVLEFYVVNSESPSLYQQLVWTQNPKRGQPGLTDNQKYLFEIVHLGVMKNIDELVEFFGQRRSNFKSRVVAPLIAKGLLEYEGSDGLKVAENFEEVLYEIFVESGGAECLEEVQEKFQKEREDYRRDDKQPHERRFEARVQAVLRGELEWEELTDHEKNEVTLRKLITQEQVYGHPLVSPGGGE